MLIPSEVPQFTDGTSSAQRLRSLYVQHKVYEVLNSRIFQPFLFTLGRRYGGVDTFLQTLASSVRQKSRRREAAWRQVTLRAAYTVSNAKQSINLVAGVIVDEILDEIRHFTAEAEWPLLIVSIRRIVKAAAEVWRYARIERELVRASFLDIAVVDDHEWHDATPSTTPPAQKDKTIHRQPILRVEPHVVRDAAHEEFLAEADRPGNSACTYLQGLALYQDSSVILERRQELDGNSSGPCENGEPHSTSSNVAIGGMADNPRVSGRIAPAKESESECQIDVRQAYRDQFTAHQERSSESEHSYEKPHTTTSVLTSVSQSTTSRQPRSVSWMQDEPSPIASWKSSGD